MVKLLDGGEERIEVHEQDGRTLPRRKRQGTLPDTRSGVRVGGCARGTAFGVDRRFAGGMWGFPSHVAHKSSTPRPRAADLC